MGMWLMAKRYDGLPEKADRLEWKTKYQKPLIMSDSAAMRFTESMETL